MDGPDQVPVVRRDNPESLRNSRLGPAVCAVESLLAMVEPSDLQASLQRRSFNVCPKGTTNPFLITCGPLSGTAEAHS